MGAALKNMGFGGRTRFHKKIMVLQVGGGGRKKTPRAILGTFWRFWGFQVKKVCKSGLPKDASQQRKYGFWGL